MSTVETDVTPLDYDAETLPLPEDQDDLETVTMLDEEDDYQDLMEKEPHPYYILAPPQDDPTAIAFNTRSWQRMKMHIYQMRGNAVAYTRLRRLFK